MNLTIPSAALAVHGHTGVGVREIRGVGHAHATVDARRLTVMVAMLMDPTVTYQDCADWFGRDLLYVQNLMDGATDRQWDLAERMAR